MKTCIFVGENSTSDFSRITSKRFAGIHSWILPRDHIIEFYSNLFSSDPSRVETDFLVVEDVIPSLVNDVKNTFLISIPSKDNIHDVVFAMNTASAPRPDGFSEWFYQYCWDVVDQLAQIVVRIVSPRQFRFIWDRHIEHGSKSEEYHECFKVYGNIPGQLVNYGKSSIYFGSSVSPTRISRLQSLVEGIGLISKNSQRDFWSDNWLGVPILEILEISDYLATLLKVRVSDFIYEGRWVLDDSFRVRFPDICSMIDRIAISPVTDSLVWAQSRDGQISCKSTYSRMICDSPYVTQWRDVWCFFIPPSRLALTWHLLLNPLPTKDRLCRVGFHLASRCIVCGG
ncbi:hypothetical protein Ddye_001036 [Dipteronia dyeriana]|uniref:Reverse transcriptase zinc-binding domain-containing protein n=1 Tax=Dipteronia dyeriana TaxID=168575 RepID=A0AAD9XNJ0_9ROSI|nr:hypothetical protein Ddye_001036 [Dipteronia dyeriana]